MNLKYFSLSTRSSCHVRIFPNILCFPKSQFPFLTISFSQMMRIDLSGEWPSGNSSGISL